MNDNKTLSIYKKAINNIDDLLEYRYKNLTKEELRERILQEIDSITDQLKGQL